MRMVIDVGGWDNSRFILPGGQSGNPVSPHCEDMLGLWEKSEGVPIYWHEIELTENKRDYLLLTPGKPLEEILTFIFIYDPRQFHVVLQLHSRIFPLSE